MADKLTKKQQAARKKLEKKAVRLENDEFLSRALDVALRYVILTPCAHCGSPVNKGYCCVICGSAHPRGYPRWMTAEDMKADSSVYRDGGEK